MNAVLDTNVVVSGLLWGGAPGRILAAARAQQLTLFTSQELLDELHTVLSRSKFTERLQRANTTVSELIRQYTALTTLVTPAPLPAAICDAPDDDAVLACALAANAAMIASGDDDLLRLGSYGAILILTVGELLQRLATTRQP